MISILCILQNFNFQEFVVTILSSVQAVFQPASLNHGFVMETRSALMAVMKNHNFAVRIHVLKVVIGI